MKFQAFLISVALLAGMSVGLAGGEATPTVRTLTPTLALDIGTVEISDPSIYTDIYAISDVHGMYSHLSSLLRNAGLIDSASHWSAGKALLIIVGDSIDKGPQSVEVIDLWIRLTSEASGQGGRVIHLLGNHEAEFLADPYNDSKAAALVAELHSRGLGVDDFTNPSRPHGAFLRSMPLAARVGSWLFCHAGLFPEMRWRAFQVKAQKLLSSAAYSDDFITGKKSILEAKNWWKKDEARSSLLKRLEADGILGVVQGHQPGAYNINDRIGAVENGRLVKIDTGMAPQAASSPGQILHIVHPAELSGARAPRMEVIEPTGTSSVLKPEAFDSYRDVPPELEGSDACKDCSLSSSARS
jgi:hypothetical protein